MEVLFIQLILITAFCLFVGFIQRRHDQGSNEMAKTTKQYTFFEDPGHGWLEVPAADVAELNLEADISGYSYFNEGKVYLEED
jgi:hypothetical protein